VPRRQRLRRDESQAQTRQALIDAASDLFEAKGFIATSIAEVADEAGYTTGALYSNFANKEDLYLAVIERQVATEMAALGEALSAEPTTAGRIELVGRWYVSHAGQGRRRARAFAEVALMAQNNADTLARLRQQREALHQSVADLVHQQEVELGVAFHVPSATLARAVTALLEGFALSSVIDEDLDEAEVIAALDLLLRPAARAGRTVVPPPAD
jgi:AcrR family transcriptional regulator